MIKAFVEQIQRKEDVRSALSGLRAAIKEEENYRKAAELFGKGEILLPFLKDSDAKVRKNAAALIGDLEIEEAAEALFLAYEKEDTLFVRGTLLQALGKTNPYPYLDRLQEQYEMLCTKDAEENEKKHIREEIHALEKILRQESMPVHHSFIGMEKKYTILLTTNPKYAQITFEKLKAERKAETSLGVKAVVTGLKDAVEIRTFRELLFPVSLRKEIRIEDGGDALGTALAESKLLALLEYSHREKAPFYFRLDLKGGISLEERSKYLKKVAVVLEEKSGRKLLNAPDEYEFEIRLLLDKTEKIHVFLKMFTIPMERFSYRKDTIASSISSSGAAMLLELSKPYLKEQAQILDPCCGVGTMLIERHKILPAREIYGIDIFGEAIEKARKNTARAGIRANYIHRDYMDFKHGYLFDEIIANMPVRGKRTKEEQDIFYEKFFEKSITLLAPEGIMILYTNENGFVKKQLRLHSNLKLKQEYLISQKDQFYLFIIGVK